MRAGCAGREGSWRRAGGQGERAERARSRSARAGNLLEGGVGGLTQVDLDRNRAPPTPRPGSLARPLVFPSRLPLSTPSAAARACDSHEVGFFDRLDSEDLEYHARPTSAPAPSSPRLPSPHPSLPRPPPLAQDPRPPQALLLRRLRPLRLPTLPPPRHLRRLSSLGILRQLVSKAPVLHLQPRLCPPPPLRYHGRRPPPRRLQPRRLRRRRRVPRLPRALELQLQAPRREAPYRPRMRTCSARGEPPLLSAFHRPFPRTPFRFPARRSRRPPTPLLVSRGRPWILLPARLSRARSSPPEAHRIVRSPARPRTPPAPSKPASHPTSLPEPPTWRNGPSPDPSLSSVSTRARLQRPAAAGPSDSAERPLPGCRTCLPPPLLPPGRFHTCALGAQWAHIPARTQYIPSWPISPISRKSWLP